MVSSVLDSIKWLVCRPVSQAKDTEEVLLPLEMMVAILSFVDYKDLKTVVKALHITWEKEGEKTFPLIDLVEQIFLVNQPFAHLSTKLQDNSLSPEARHFLKSRLIENSPVEDMTKPIIPTFLDRVLFRQIPSNPDIYLKIGRNDLLANAEGEEVDEALWQLIRPTYEEAITRIIGTDKREPRPVSVIIHRDIHSKIIRQCRKLLKKIETTHKWPRFIVSMTSLRDHH